MRLLLKALNKFLFHIIRTLGAVFRILIAGFFSHAFDPLVSSGTHRFKAAFKRIPSRSAPRLFILVIHRLSIGVFKLGFKSVIWYVVLFSSFGEVIANLIR